MTIVVNDDQADEARRVAATAKAATLIEALPWLDRFHGETVVIKYGGHAMTDGGTARRVRPGPGVPAARRAAPGGRARRRPAGHRAPGPARHRVGLHRRAAGDHGRDHRRRPDGAQRQGQQGHRRPDQPVRAVAVGLSGEDANLFTAARKAAVVDGEPVDIGLVGEIVGDRSRPGQGRSSRTAGSRCMSSVARGADGDGVVYNVNADTAAAALAVALGAAKLVVLTDVAGLYRDWPDLGRGDQPARRRRPGKAAAGAVGRHDPEDGGLPHRGAAAASRRRTCSTAGWSTRSCWRSSPTPASAPW